jgi:hypothetical protein
VYARNRPRSQSSTVRSFSGAGTIGRRLSEVESRVTGLMEGGSADELGATHRFDGGLLRATSWRGVILGGFSVCHWLCQCSGGRSSKLPAPTRGPDHREFALAKPVAHGSTGQLPCESRTVAVWVSRRSRRNPPILTTSYELTWRDSRRVFRVPLALPVLWRTKPETPGADPGAGPTGVRTGKASGTRKHRPAPPLRSGATGWRLRCATPSASAPGLRSTRTGLRRVGSPGRCSGPPA